MANGRPVDPKLTINGSQIGFIDKETFKFLGKLLSADVSDTAAREKVFKVVEASMVKFDSLPLTSSQKI